MKSLQSPIVLICCILAVGFCGFTTPELKERTQVNKELSLTLPPQSKKIDELFAKIKKVNPTIIFFRTISTQDQQFLFAVSHYKNAQPLQLAQAFKSATKINEPLSSTYKLISLQSYKKGNTLLYRKISNPFKGQCSVMYYFMKNNYSTTLYEIKLSGPLKHIEKIKNMAEKIALSVKI